jgi:hypothetical protein
MFSKHKITFGKPIGYDDFLKDNVTLPQNGTVLHRQRESWYEWMAKKEPLTTEITCPIFVNIVYMWESRGCKPGFVHLTPNVVLHRSLQYPLFQKTALLCCAPSHESFTP